MSPDGLFRKKNVFVFLNSPCYETPEKRVKKIDEKLKIKISRVSNHFFFALQQMYVTFVLFFFGAPLAENQDSSRYPPQHERTHPAREVSKTKADVHITYHALFPKKNKKSFSFRLPFYIYRE
jgi:hypothetical protein